MSRLRNRVDRLAAALPPPPAPRGPDALTEAELRKLPTAELAARVAEGMARWRESPEGRARRAELETMSAEKLLNLWNRPSWRRG